MDGRVPDGDPTQRVEELCRLADALIGLGESKTAADLLRREVYLARSEPPSESIALLRLLSGYAGVLEGIDAFAEADFVRAEALQIVEAAQLATFEGVDAFLRYGQLQCKMKNYEPAIGHLQEATRRAERLDGVDELQRQIVLAEAWRSLALAFEAVGEFSQASDALDVLTTAKRRIRFLVFSSSRKP
jgi:tetratricopeptide (TPR) repeat protein